MALDFQSFLGGMATTLVENEKMSAKLGLEEYKEALDDYREEAKNYAEEVDKDTKEYIELANVLTPLLKDPNKVTAVLDRGRAFTKLFIQKAEQTAERKGYDSVADLVRVSEAYEGIIDPIDWIRSGAPIEAIAPTYGGPKEMKTAVFGRDIDDGGKRVEGIESAYIRSRKGEPLTAPMAEIDLIATKDLSKERFGTPSRTDISYSKATILKTLADMSGVSADYVTDASGALQTKLSGASEAQQARLRADAETVFNTFFGQAKEQDIALPFERLEGDSIAWAAGKYDAKNDTFYQYAPQVMSVSRANNQSTQANTAALTGGSTQQGSGAQQQQQAQQPPAQNPANHPKIQAQINNMGASTRSRRNIVAGVLVTDYGMSVADAKAEAQRLIP